MFKYKFDICVNCSKPRLIVVKAGLCKYCNEKRKKDAKKIIKTINAGYSIPALVKELDRVFSIFIRRREVNSEGLTRCVTCGYVDKWQRLDCGHYHSRRYYSTRWEEKNCGVQCKRCNIFSEGNKPEFIRYLVAKYGEGVLQELEIKKNNTFRLVRFNLITLINYYKEKNGEP